MGYQGRHKAPSPVRRPPDPYAWDGPYLAMRWGGKAEGLI